MSEWVVCVCILLGLLDVAVKAQVSTKGHCAIFDSKGKFSVTQFYSGTWYVMESYPNRYYGPNAICQEFAMTSDAKYVYFNETIYDTSSSSQKSLSGSARFSRKGEPNHLVLYPGHKSLTQGGDVWIVATDYNNYALMYVCSSASRPKDNTYPGKKSSFGKDKAGKDKSVKDKPADYKQDDGPPQKKKEYMFVLSRKPTLSPGMRANIVIENIVRGGFPVAPLAPMNQLDCPIVDRSQDQ